MVYEKHRAIIIAGSHRIIGFIARASWHTHRACCRAGSASNIAALLRRTLATSSGCARYNARALYIVRWTRIVAARENARIIFVSDHRSFSRSVSRASSRIVTSAPAFCAHLHSFSNAIRRRGSNAAINITARAGGIIKHGAK